MRDMCLKSSTLLLLAVCQYVVSQQRFSIDPSILQRFTLGSKWEFLRLNLTSSTVPTTPLKHASTPMADRATLTMPMSTEEPCEDYDTEACVLMQKNRPDLCSEPGVSETACKRFCGFCPLQCYSCSSLVNDMSLCTTRTECDFDQVCYTMEVFDFDQSHGFRGGCMSKDLCIPHTDIELFGRSSSNLQFACCDSNLCNSAMTTTTSTSTPSTTTHRRFPFLTRLPVLTAIDLDTCHDEEGLNCDSIFSCSEPLQNRCQKSCNMCK